MTRTQLENLIEYYLVMYCNAYGEKCNAYGEKLDSMSPDYLVEKFTNYIGTTTEIRVGTFSDKHERSYHKYCKRWHFLTEPAPLFKQIFMMLCDQQGNCGSPEALLSWFDKYFMDHERITHIRYSYMNIKIKIDMYDKLIATPAFSRYLKIMAFGI